MQGEALVAEAATSAPVATPAAADAADGVAVAAPAIPVATEAAAVEQPVAGVAVTSETTLTAAAPAGESAQVALRQGLPRTPGGEPWPATGTVRVSAPVSAASVATAEAPAAASVASVPAEAAAAVAGAPAVAASAPAAPSGAVAATETVSEEVTLRQGLPRVVGGEAWPPAGAVTVERAVASLPVADAAESTAPAVETVPAEAVTPASPAAPTVPAAVPAPVPVAAKPVTPADAPATAPASASPVKPAKPAREPIMIGSRTLGQWMGLAVLWGGGAIVAAGIIVLAARGVTTLPGVPEFLERYPGEYALPEFVDPGFPAWVRWAHFLNFFLMVMIIRSGLLVRQQQKPDAFFTPKKGGKKISIYLWLHTSLDVLWVVNGLAFVVLMFITGHWARIVPTSWEVFPNALSAMLQYLTLEWPVEDGWVNYNSLQQIMYFTVVFIAAPLAIITGVRMSEWWPQKAEKLNKLYPAPVARAIHFPTMLFFVLFILIHVFLVFTTGALKNLNHMFVGTPEVSWLGFWMFALGLLVTAAVTWAARPLVLAPIANLFGRVSER